jgi:hypothetical protein
MIACVLGDPTQQAWAQRERRPISSPRVPADRGLPGFLSSSSAMREPDWPASSSLGSSTMLLTEDVALADEPQEHSERPAEPPSSLSTSKHPTVAPRTHAVAYDEVNSFLVAIRGLVQSDQLAAARRLLGATPIWIRSDPGFADLRLLLSPPAVRTVRKQDVDRAQDYAWLRTEAHKHRGRWVALSEGSLLATARTLVELQRILRTVASGTPPLLHRID